MSIRLNDANGNRGAWAHLSTKSWIFVVAFIIWAASTAMTEHQVLSTPRDRQDETTQQAAITAKSPPVHVLFGLSGNHSGFLSEFEVSMKSVMMNAPLERDLTIHVMADELAYGALDEVFQRSEIEKWEGRNLITIQSYNVESYLPGWRAKVKDLFNSTGFIGDQSKAAFEYHTIGCWFRLFCHHVLPTTVEHVLYMDTDVVVMANLEELWRHADAKYHFQWGVLQCSGFLLLNLPKLEEVWQEARTLPLANISISTQQAPNDQLVFRAVYAAHLERHSVNTTSANINKEVRGNVGILPDEWDLSKADGIWKFRNDLVIRRPQIGMLHFNGGGGSKETYYTASQNWLDPPELNGSFGLAKYFIYMPWTWARFQAASMISGSMTADGKRPEGFALQLLHKKNAPNEEPVVRTGSQSNQAVSDAHHLNTTGATRRRRRHHR